MENLKQYIVEEQRVIDSLNEGIMDKKTNPEMLSDIKDAIFTYSLNKTIAHYSAGDFKVLVTASLVDAISAFEEGFHWEGFAKSYAMYDQMVWMLSLGILCELEEDPFKRIVAVIQRDGAQDELLKTLVNYRLPNTMSGSSYIQKSPYAHLDSLVIGQGKSMAFIKTYLTKKWYQGHRDAPWYDSHKRTQVNTYFGYWAWEVGALVKIYGIADEELKEQPYYPYRALHWS
ncbi:PoNe immunity protein domain-containing protein [Myroides odoratus]